MQERKKDFRIAPFEGPGGDRLYVLWTMDEDGVWVFPGAARSREGIRRLGETIHEVGSMWDPRMPAAIARLTTQEGIEFIELDLDTQDALGAQLAASLPPAGEA